jgi:hypothetical protein
LKIQFLNDASGKKIIEAIQSITEEIFDHYKPQQMTTTAPCFSSPVEQLIVYVNKYDCHHPSLSDLINLSNAIAGGETCEALASMTKIIKHFVRSK